MADKERRWSVDWRTFNWNAVDKEIEEKNPQYEENFTTITKGMVVEYIHWLNEKSPVLLYIVSMAYKLQQAGAPKEDLAILSNLWDELTGRKE